MRPTGSGVRTVRDPAVTAQSAQIASSRDRATKGSATRTPATTGSAPAREPRSAASATWYIATATAAVTAAGSPHQTHVPRPTLSAASRTAWWSTP